MNDWDKSASYSRAIYTLLGDVEDGFKVAVFTDAIIAICLAAKSKKSEILDLIEEHWDRREMELLTGDCACPMCQTMDFDEREWLD